MNKKILSIITVLFTCLVLVACQKKAEPVIEGVKATAVVKQGEPFNALNGVTAKNYKGNDITKSIVVTSNPKMEIVNGVFTPTEYGEYIISYSVTDSGFTTTATTFLTVEQVLNLTEELYKEYKFNELAEGATLGFVNEDNDGGVGSLSVDQGALVYDITAFGTGIWSNKITKSGLELKGGTNYTYKITLKATFTGNAEIFIKDDGKEEWTVFAGKYDYQLTENYQTLELTFKPEVDTTGTLFIQVGGKEGSGKVFVSGIDVVTTLNPKNLDYPFSEIVIENEQVVTPGWHIETNTENSQATHRVENGKITYNVTKFSASPWENKVWRNDVQVMEGRTYEVTFNIKTSSTIQFTFVAKNGDPALIWTQRTVTDLDGVKSYTFTFKANKTESIEMIFEFGGQNNQNGNGAVIELSDLVLVEYESNATTSTRFTGLPAGFASYEQAPGKASLYIDAAQAALIYNIESFGVDDWHNKAFIEEGITFETGSKYRVEFTIHSSKEMKGFFAVNVKGQWSPKVTAGLDLTTTNQTFTYTTESLQSFDQPIELLFQFGGQGNTGTAQVSITSIKIFKLTEK